jgi:hypothetical protein
MAATRITAASNHVAIVALQESNVEILAAIKALTATVKANSPAKTVTRTTAKATTTPKNAKVMTRAALRDLKAQGKIPAGVTCKEAVLLKGFKSWTLPSGAMRIAIREATEAKANA